MFCLVRFAGLYQYDPQGDEAKILEDRLGIPVIRHGTHLVTGTPFILLTSFERKLLRGKGYYSRHLSSADWNEDVCCFDWGKVVLGVIQKGQTRNLSSSENCLLKSSTGTHFHMLRTASVSHLDTNPTFAFSWERRTEKACWGCACCVQILRLWPLRFDHGEPHTTENAMWRISWTFWSQ